MEIITHRKLWVNFAFMHTGTQRNYIRVRGGVLCTEDFGKFGHWF